MFKGSNDTKAPFSLFQVHPDFNAFDAVNCFLQFIPLEDEILDFFRPVASQILQQLRGRPFLPTQPNAQGKSKTRFLKFVYQFSSNLESEGRLFCYN